MANLASEWGFQAFEDAPIDYPGNEVEQPEDPGTRSSKTGKRRQRQLEDLVAGVVRLDRSAAGDRQLGNRLTNLTLSSTSFLLIVLGAPASAHDGRDSSASTAGGRGQDAVCCSPDGFHSPHRGSSLAGGSLASGAVKA